MHIPTQPNSDHWEFKYIILCTISISDLLKHFLVKDAETFSKGKL